MGTVYPTTIDTKEETTCKGSLTARDGYEGVEIIVEADARSGQRTCYMEMSPDEAIELAQHLLQAAQVTRRKIREAK